jgi:hypothetical protein
VLIDDLMHGQYGNPARIVAFNTRDAWSRDVTKDIACELRRRLVEYADVPVSVQAFVEARRLITHATVTTSAISRCC